MSTTVNARSRILVVLCAILLAPPGVPVHAGDRRPVVAGQFYPGQPDELRRTVQSLLAGATPRAQGERPLALIVPHAGYQYSGAIAASGFNQLSPSADVQRVFLIGSSHRMAIQGAAVYCSGDFLTPLGRIPVDRTLGSSLVSEHRVLVEQDEAHTYEHSLEVELPFLQVVLERGFTLVPIVIGTDAPADLRAIAAALRPYWGGRNLFVVSTDLSHYPPAGVAAEVDRATLAAVCTGSSQRLLNVLEDHQRRRGRDVLTPMCGSSSVLTLLYLLEQAGPTTVELVRYGNSGDVPGGDRTRVVGYAALAVRALASSGFQVPPDDQRRLLAIARSSLAGLFDGNRTPSVAAVTRSPMLREPGAAFVTLYRNGRLRGCIGSFARTQPLSIVVEQMARAAAREDPRFPPLRAEELDGVRVEISVLSPLRRVAGAADIELGRHGIYLRKGERGGTFLPHVATETGWSVEEFLGHCAADKAGIGWDGWKSAELYVYEACVFGEPERR